MSTLKNLKAHDGFGVINTQKRSVLNAPLKHPKKSGSSAYLLSVASGAYLAQYIDSVQLELVLNAVVSICTVWIVNKLNRKK